VNFRGTGGAAARWPGRWPALAPLRLPRFRRLAFAYTVNELGNWLGDVALAVLVYDHTGSALATAGLFLGSKFVPGAVGPALTTRLERHDARATLPLLYALEGALFAALAASQSHLPLAGFIVLAALDGSAAVTAKALSRTATAGVLTPHGLLAQGNALLNVGFTAGSALGPAIAGALIAAAGAATALAVDAASFAAAAIALLGAGTLPVTPGGAEPDPWSVRLRAGLRHAWQSPPLRALLTGQAVALIFFTAVVPIEVVFAKGTLHAGSAGYGALLASWGGGMIAGALVFARVHGRSIVATLGFSTVAIGAAYLGIAVSPTLAVACLASAAGGAGNGVQWVALLTAVQEATPAAMLARTMALLESVGTVMPGVGFVLGGVVAAAVSARAAYAIAGGGVLLIAALAAPAVRTLAAERQLARARPEPDVD
jgi:Transmembrane secretion effector